MYMSTQLNKYKSIFIIFILLLLNGNFYAQQGWYNMNVSFGGAGIYFKDLNTGIISGYKTTNGGANWYYVGFGANMSFPAVNTGYGVSANAILKTTNFGDNWIYQSNPSFQNLNSINFPNVNTGYACGEGGTLIKTTNGGNNWLINDPISPPLSSAYYFAGVYFIDVQTGYIVGCKYASDTSVFLRTTNGGVNWTTQLYTASNWGKFTSMIFINPNTGFIGSGSNSYILKTINGGINWNQIIIPTSNSIYSMNFSSVNTGYVSCNGGQILKSTNNGNNWFLQTTGTGSILRSIFFINDLTGYCSGDNNTVLKTTDGGGAPIGITPISNEVPIDFRLEQNYPNPFNPVTNINFSIPKAGFTSIRIYDITGRLVQTLFETQLAPGSYKADWNASQMPSGIYIYRIESGSFIQSRKMILLK